MTADLVGLADLLPCICGAVVDQEECPYPSGAGGVSDGRATFVVDCTNPNCGWQAIGWGADGARKQWNTRAELRALGGGWLPIESAPRDGSWFVTANFTNPIEEDGDFEIARYKPTYWTRYEATEGGLFKQVKELSMEFDCNNWHRATHWQPLPPSPAATVEG